MENYSLRISSLEELVDAHALDADTYELEYFQLEGGLLVASYLGVNCMADHWSHKAIQRPILSASQETYDRRLLMHGKSPENSTSVMLVTSPACMRWNGELVKRGDILIIPPGQDVEILVDAGLNAMDIHMANEAMDDILIHTGTEPPGRPKVLRPSWPVWLDLCQSARCLIGVNEPCGGGKQDEKVMYSDAVVENLTRALDQTRQVKHDVIVSPSRRGRVAKSARNWLSTVLDRQVTTAEICTVTETSARVLQMAFRETYGISPVAYGMLVRLHLARNDLIAADPAIFNVTSVASSRGFTHLGRFSVAYRRQFGESPSDTLNRPSKQVF